MKKITRKKIVFRFCVAGVFALLLGIITITSFVFKVNANEGGGVVFDDNTVGTIFGCYKSFDAANRNARDVWNDTCFGATWRKYPVGSISYYVHSSDRSRVEEWNSDCQNAGASEYYRLGFERFNTFHSSDPSKYTARNEQKGFRQVSTISGHGGSTTFNPAGLDWDSVEEMFNKGKAEYEKHPSDPRWSTFSKSWSETSGFCWNPNWEAGSANSDFAAFSKLKTTAGGEKTSGADGDVSDELTVDTETATVEFWHQLVYHPVKQEGDFGEASTNWTVRVTKDGADITSEANPQPTSTHSAGDGKSRSEQSSGSAGKIIVNKGNEDGEVWSPYVARSVVTVEVPEAGEVRVCSKIDYNPKNIGWKQNESSKKYGQDAETSNGNEDSQACVTIKRGEETEGDGGQVRFWSKSKVTGVGSGSDYNGSDLTAETDENLDNDSVSLYYSTIKDSFSLKFEHQLKYIHEGRGGGDRPSSDTTDKDVFPVDICTEYTITRLNKDGTTNKLEADKGCANPETLRSGGGEVNESPWPVKHEGDVLSNISIGKGEEIKICEKVSYNPKVVFLKRKAIKVNKTSYEKVTNYQGQALYKADGSSYAPAFSDWDKRYTVFSATSKLYVATTDLEKIDAAWGGAVQGTGFIDLYEKVDKLVFDHWEYMKDGDDGNDGSSEVCAVVRRPGDVPSEDYPWTKDSSGSSTDPMFAGEKSSIGWEHTAEWYDSHQITEWRAIIFQIVVGRARNEGELTGNSVRNVGNPDPCNYYSANLSGSLRFGCETTAGRNDFSPSTLSNGKGNDPGIPNIQDMIVPNEVGDKYCTSSGYQWQFFWGKGKGDVRPTSWIGGKTYWTIYDAACSPIAKKPSISVINGGISAAGDVITSVSTRRGGYGSDESVSRELFNKNANFYSGSITMFGSWAEYLAAVKGDVKGDTSAGFSSGATLSWDGVSGSNFNLLDHSPMTIRNTTEPFGKSGITTNSAIRTRLLSYFGSINIADVLGRTEIGGADSINGDTETWDNVENTHIVYADNVITIKDDIVLADVEASNIQRIPQVVVYAKNGINIASNVQRIDAWLITDGTVNTCDVWKKGTTAGTQARVLGYNNPDPDCANQLVINGPIFASKLITNRSYGASTGVTNGDRDDYGVFAKDDRAISGEILNLSAENYLWAYAQAGRYASSYTEAYSRELPPRY